MPSAVREPATVGLAGVAIALAIVDDRARRCRQAALTGTGGRYDPREYDRLILERRRLRQRLWARRPAAEARAA